MKHCVAFFAAQLLLSQVAVYAVEPPPPHPLTGQRFVPKDVNWLQPAYVNNFEHPDTLKDLKLEGGKSMHVINGYLVLESTNAPDMKDHLVCWLTQEMPADLLLEFKMRPRDRKDGLNIVFFNTRGVHGENIFDSGLTPRTGVFSQYHSGDLNGYHASYWAGDRDTAHIRKNKGFALVATGPDLVANAARDAFQTIRLYKRGGTLRLMVDDVISVAFDDDGKTFGPVWTHSGWIGLRQMTHTVSCEYDDLKVFPLNP